MNAPDSSSVMPITSEAARRAFRWVQEVCNAQGHDAAHAVWTVAVAQVCSVLNERLTDEVDSFLQRTSETMPAPCWTDFDLLSALIAATAICRDSTVAGNSAAEYLHQLRGLGRQRNGGNNATLLALALPGAGNGLDANRDHAAEPAPGMAHGFPLSDQRPEDFCRLLTSVEARTKFGRIPLHDAVLAGVLEGAAISALRTHDLPLGMRALRACRYLRNDHSLGLAYGFEFLRFNQDDDGGFGDCESAILRMIAQGHTDAAPRVRLPMTMLALWTMGEIERPPFRLLGKLFPHGHHLECQTRATDSSPQLGECSQKPARREVSNCTPIQTH